MTTRHAPFSGVGVALVTLFDRDGGLDAPATADHARRLVEEGAQAVVVAGSTGEASALDTHERVELIDTVRGAVEGRVPVVAGSGAPSARQAVVLSRQAVDAGADALLVLSPPGGADPRPYFDQVVEAVEVPVLAYHFPTMSPPGIPVDVVCELPVAGLKDSSEDPVRLAIEADEMQTGLYVGSAALLVHGQAIGCTGAILALANLDLGGCITAWEGNGDCQRELISGHRAGGLAGITGLKRSLASLHGTSPVTRLG